MYQWIRLEKLYKLMERFFQILESYFELTTIFKNNIGVGFMHAACEVGEAFGIFSEIDEPLDFNETLVSGSIFNVISLNNILVFFTEIVIEKVLRI